MKAADLFSLMLLGGAAYFFYRFTQQAAPTTGWLDGALTQSSDVILGLPLVTTPYAPNGPVVTYTA